MLVVTVTTEASHPVWFWLIWRVILYSCGFCVSLLCDYAKVRNISLTSIKQIQLPAVATRNARKLNQWNGCFCFVCFKVKFISDRPSFFLFCLMAKIIQTGVYKECVQNYKQSPKTLIASNYCWCKWGKVEDGSGCYYIPNDSLISRKECGIYRTFAADIFKSVESICEKHSVKGGQKF